jgi:hypothetical protein
VVLSFLDDTGSTSPSVFQDDDLQLLGIFPGGFGWGDPMVFNTANGVVERDTCYFNMIWLGNDGRPLENQFHMEHAVIMPGRSTDNEATRLSGMSLRRTIFTGTAPDGNGVLYLAHKKNGVTSNLPVV